MGQGLAHRPVIVKVSRDLRGDSWGCAPRSLFWREDLDRDGERGFDYLTFALVLSKAPREGVGLCVADSHTCNHLKGGFTPLKTIRRFMVVIGRRSYSGFEWEAFEPGDEGLKTTWKHSPKRPGIYHRGQGVLCSEGLMNVADSDDPSYGEDEQTLIGPSLFPHPEVSKKFKILGKRKVASGVPGKALPLKVQKVPAQASKVAGEASTPLDVDNDSNIHEFPSAKELKDATDCHWVVAHVTSPSWKQHLREISIEQLCDIHDRSYMRQVVLDNVLNSRTRELISALYKAKTSYDDLDKNPLVSDMHVKIKALQGQVDGLYGEYSRLILEEKKWVDYEQTLSSLRVKIKGIKFEKERLKSSKIQLLQEIDSLNQDRAVVVSKVIPDAAMKLIRNDDLGILIAKLVRSSIIYGRCQAFEEVAAMEEPFVLEKMSTYRPSSKEEYDQASDALANASYPFLAEYVTNPYASLEQLLSKKPPLL
ncbi:hypothetical protein Tco_0888141 [Tanacetum coccineum]